MPRSCHIMPLLQEGRRDLSAQDDVCKGMNAICHVIFSYLVPIYSAEEMKGASEVRGSFCLSVFLSARIYGIDGAVDESRS